MGNKKGCAMRSILTLTTAVAVLFTLTSTAHAQSRIRLGDLPQISEAPVLSPSIPAPVQPRAMPVAHTTVSQPGIKDCGDFYAARGGWVSPTCTGAELTVYLSAKGMPMAPPTVQQAQTPAPYDHPLTKVTYQHTCEPTAAGGRTCYGRDPGPSALEWVAVLGGLTTRVIYATHGSYRW